METQTTSKLTKEQARERLAQVLRLIVYEVTASDLVEVSFTAGENTTVYQVVVNPEQKGRLIGSQGRNILALRNLVTSIGHNYGLRAIIELVI